MNRYGLMAQKHWARWLPTRYALIEDPGSFFSDLGTQAAQQIDDLAMQLAGDDQPGEGYLGKAGRLGQARHQAEEIVLADLILLEPEPGTEDDPESTDPGSTDSAPRPTRKLVTFRPATQNDLAPSGAVTRVRANLAALTTLRQIQHENRPATPDEQQIMARWSGWGAVPEVFDDRRTEFAWARDQLADLLDPERAGGGRAQHPQRPLHRRSPGPGHVGSSGRRSASTAARSWNPAAAAATSSASPRPPPA